MHTFEEIRTRTPANPNEATLQAAMQQAAWEALLRDAVQGLRPPHTPKALRWWLQTTQPQAWAIGDPQDPPHPTTTTPERKRTQARGGQGTGRNTPARGRGGAQVNRQAPKGTGHRGRHDTGARNHQRARKGKNQGPWRRERGRNSGQQGAHTGRACHNGGSSTAPPAADTARPDAVRTAPAHAHQPPEPAQGREGTPTRGEGATPTEGAAENTAAQPTTTPSPPGDNPSLSKGHHTGTRRGRGHGCSTQG